MLASSLTACYRSDISLLFFSYLVLSEVQSSSQDILKCEVGLHEMYETYMRAHVKPNHEVLYSCTVFYTASISPWWSVLAESPLFAVISMIPAVVSGTTGWCGP